MFNDLFTSEFNKAVVKIVSEQLNIDEQVLSDCIRPDETIDIEELKRRTERDIPNGVIEYLKKHNELIKDDVSQIEYISEIKSFRDEFLEDNGFFILQQDADEIADILEETCFADSGEQITIEYNIDTEYYFAKEGWTDKVSDFSDCIVSQTSVTVPAQKVSDKGAVTDALEQLKENKSTELTNHR